MYCWNYHLTGDSTLPPLLLLHGWMGSGADYLDLMPYLDRFYYCIAIDLPGHGNTDVIGSDRGYGFAMTAAGIWQLLDRLGISTCYLSGYSMGGRLAAYLWLNYPHRLRGALLESAGWGLASPQARQARDLDDRRTIRKLQTLNLATFIHHWYRQPLFAGIDRVPGFEHLIARRLQNRPLELVKSLHYAGLARQPYLGTKLQLDRRPLRLMAGQNDRKFVESNQTIGGNCPHVSVEIVPHCSHNIHFQQPQAWLKSMLKLLQHN
jgi:2-succinyl-6-hydroxy-2,4-cyclohexadiene-1-carboxylate synthase